MGMAIGRQVISPLATLAPSISSAWTTSPRCLELDESHVCFFGTENELPRSHHGWLIFSEFGEFLLPENWG